MAQGRDGGGDPYGRSGRVVRFELDQTRTKVSITVPILLTFPCILRSMEVQSCTFAALLPPNASAVFILIARHLSRAATCPALAMRLTASPFVGVAACPNLLYPDLPASIVGGAKRLPATFVCATSPTGAFRYRAHTPCSNRGVLARLIAGVGCWLSRRTP